MKCKEIMKRVAKFNFLSISKSNISIGKNKLKIERIKDASKKIYSDISCIFSGKLFFKECQVFSLSKVLFKFCMSI